jgi:hypothetical protein
MNDPKRRIEAERAADVPGEGAVCEPFRCRCPTCGTAELLLRTKLLARGYPKEDRARVSIQATACGDGSYPFIASVRVDGREVYRIMNAPDEVFAEDVLEDITKALRRPM